MTRYQLIGRKKPPAPSNPPVKYSLRHLCGLPHEILLQIFDQLSTKDLISVAQTCCRFRNIINKTYLYKTVTLTRPTLAKFAVHHLRTLSKSPLSKKFKVVPSSNINYIASVNLINPPSRDCSNRKISIAGSYDVVSDYKRDGQSNYESYVVSLRFLLEDSYGLKHVSMSEVPPSFEFSKDMLPVPEKRSFWKKPGPSRSLESLQLKSQSGWSITFKWSLVSLFFSYYDSVSELTLHNFVFDDQKLISTSIPEVNIHKLTLDGCIYSDTLRKNNQPKSLSPLFAHTHTLELTNITHGTSLSAIDFIKQNNKLQTLILDIGSPMFYSRNEEKRIFQYAKYNPFFKLLCSGVGGFSSLKSLQLINFDLFDCLNHDLEASDVDSWVEPPTDTFECFLSYVGNIQNLTLILPKQSKTVSRCKDCGHSSGVLDKSINNLNPTEWNYLLSPLLSTNKCELTVKNFNGKTLFTRFQDT